MAISYDSASFINAVKRSAAVPISQNTFTETDILELASEEISLSVVPEIIRLHEDYYLVTQSTPLVANQASYAIPSRAIGNKLVDVQYVDDSNNRFELFRIPIGHLSDYDSRTNVSRLEHYYVKDNKVFFVPTPNISTGSLEFSYYFRPNKLVTNAKAGVITAIDSGTSTVTISNFPDTFVENVQVDFIQKLSPHRTIAYDQSISSVDSVASTVTFTSLPDDLVKGDHIALSGETIIPQIPSELHPLLVERVVYRIMTAQGDAQGAQFSGAKIREGENKLGTIIDDRVESSPRKVINRNGFISNINRRKGLYRFR